MCSYPARLVVAVGPTEHNLALRTHSAVLHNCGAGNLMEPLLALFVSVPVRCCAVPLQLNNAATEVTRLHGMHVIDLGGMVFGLEPKQYLDDQHHPVKASRLHGRADMTVA